MLNVGGKQAYFELKEEVDGNQAVLPDGSGRKPG